MTCPNQPCPWHTACPQQPLYNNVWVPAPRVPHRCPVCEGRGTVPVNFYTRASATTDAGDIACRSCVGGIIYV